MVLPVFLSEIISNIVQESVAEENLFKRIYNSSTRYL